MSTSEQHPRARSNRSKWIIGLLIALGATLLILGAIGAIGQFTSADGPDCEPDYGNCIPVADIGCNVDTDPNCIPVGDVDCPDVGGDGPRFAPGPVAVTGTDIYDLDSDGNGIACD